MNSSCFNSCQEGMLCSGCVGEQKLVGKMDSYSFQNFFVKCYDPICLFVHSFVHLIYFLEHISFPFGKVWVKPHQKKVLKAKSAMTFNLDQGNS